LKIWSILGLATMACLAPSSRGAEPSDATVQVGFGEREITPTVGAKPVYMAGFGQNRKATKVHDSLMARAIVFRDGERTIALVSIDVVGYFNPNVIEIRKKLPGFTYVLVSSTHNHEGPDTLGLWGPNPFTSGIDVDYMKMVEERIIQAVREAETNVKTTTAKIGTAQAPELLHDSREPYIKHDELVALQFDDPKSGKIIGIAVQWNCHPETLAGKNTEISADFVHYSVKELQDKYRCPVVYLTGTVGGLMTSLHVEVKDDKGNLLKDGTFEKTEKYGRLIGQLAEKALAGARPVQLTPLEVRSTAVLIPMVNPRYHLARQLGVLRREAYLWMGDIYKGEPADPRENKKPMAIRTEVGWLRLGALEVAAIPGEIYPELILDKVQDPPDPGADFPDAPIEPAIYKQMKGPYRMIIGLANDEIGYIIPKRQWDEKPPFCYGRKKDQYGEENSLGPDTAPVLCRAFKELVEKKMK
jgi:hypothetical protein